MLQIFNNFKRLLKKIATFLKVKLGGARCPPGAIKSNSNLSLPRFFQGGISRNFSPLFNDTAIPRLLIFILALTKEPTAGLERHTKIFILTF